MKRNKDVIASLFILGCIAGCASGGGGSGSSGPATDPALQPLRAGYEPSECGTLYGYPIECIPYLPFGGQREVAPRVVIHPFTSWSTVVSGEPHSANGLSEAVIYRTDPPPVMPVGGYWDFPERKIGTVSGPYVGAGEDALLNFYADGKPLGMYAAGWAMPQEAVSFFKQDSPVPTDLAGIAEPGIAVGHRAVHPGGVLPNTPFASLPAAHVALIAMPREFGWDYQTFGIWNDNAPHRSGGTGDTWIVAASAGAPTPASAVPTTGFAEFNGKVAAFHISPTGVGSIAVADVKVGANFGNRTLDFASTNTRTTRDFATATPAPALNIRGTLTYSPAANRFSGTLSNAGGTLSGSSRGQYYGPSAQELGGVFTLRSPTSIETFTGAYGAKR